MLGLQNHTNIEQIGKLTYLARRDLLQRFQTCPSSTSREIVFAIKLNHHNVTRVQYHASMQDDIKIRKISFE